MEKNKLVKDGVKYKFSQYEKAFQNNDAKNYFSKARTNSTVGTIFAFTGGALIGVSLPMVLKKKQTSQINGPYGPMYYQTDGPYGWGYLLGGVAFAGISIPFALAANKNAKKAIQLENGESMTFQPYFKLESVGNGMALSYNF